MKMIDKRERWFFWGILAVYLTLLSVFFGRGFDITDESYYLINYKYLSSLAGCGTFFGAYLGGAYLLFGESIWAIRFFGLVMLMAGSYFFALEFFKRLSVEVFDTKYLQTGATAVACAAMAFYSVFGTLYTPGYNLLVLILMLFSTGLVLRLSREEKPNKALFVLYGICMGAMLFTKFPSFFSTLAAQLLIAALLCMSRRWWLIGKLLAAMLAGILVNYGYLTWLVGDIFKKYLLGIEQGLLLVSRDVTKEIEQLFFFDIPNIVLGAMPNLLYVLPAVVIVALVLNQVGRLKKWRDWAVVLIISIIILSPSGFLSSRYALNSSIWVAIVLFWLIGWYDLRDNKKRFTSGQAKNTMLMIIVALLPVAHAFGTGNPIQLAVGMSVVFPIAVCIWLLISLCKGNSIGRMAFFISVAIIALAPLSLLAMQWTQATKTYRLSTGLKDQNVNVEIGKAIIATENKSARAFGEFKAILHKNGFKEGTPILDTTNSPGLVLVGNGRPLGSAWLFTGYSGSNANALSLLQQHVTSEDIRSSWILSTPSPNVGLDWVGIISQVLGSVPFRKVGSFCLPVTEGNNTCYSAGGSLSKTIEVWMPSP
jgi:hypothetical protein